jgi:hypothetical protein
VFENYLLASVPYADKLNTHTWVLDQAPLKLGRIEAPSWNSFWTGTRPVQWMTENINGRNRALHVSKDADGVNRLWEAFTPDRMDERCPITWWVETRGFNAESPGKLKQFRYADIFVSELRGTVDIAVFWAGAYRGKYKKILEQRLEASVGPFTAGVELDMETHICDFKKQSRPLRTQDGMLIISDETLSSCGVEAPTKEFKDEAFQLLIVGSGPGAVRGYITYVEPPKNEDDSGACPKSEEGESNFVRFDGGASSEDTITEACAEFGANNPRFTSTRTESVTQGGITEVASGSAESFISQANADRIASCIAIELANHNLQEQLPKIVSQGELANE